MKYSVSTILATLAATLANFPLDIASVEVYHLMGDTFDVKLVVQGKESKAVFSPPDELTFAGELPEVVAAIGGVPVDKVELVQPVSSVMAEQTSTEERLFSLFANEEVDI